MFWACHALILCCTERKDSILQIPFHCFMCHLQTETSCSFHTSSVLAPEPGHVGVIDSV